MAGKPRVPAARITFDSPTGGGRVLLKPNTAAILRMLATYFSVPMDTFVQELLELWLKKHPEAKVFWSDSAKEPSEQRQRGSTRSSSGRRRTAQ